MTAACAPRVADLYDRQTAKLGPDPLREDADGELVWARMQASRKPVGLVLMDQSMIAGIGNIYRAEILFKERPGLWDLGLSSAPACLLSTEHTSLTSPNFMLGVHAHATPHRTLLVTCGTASCPAHASGDDKGLKPTAFGRRACTQSRRPTLWSGGRLSASGGTRWSCFGAVSNQAQS